jgi:hypothetical protein
VKIAAATCKPAHGVILSEAKNLELEMFASLNMTTRLIG